MSARCRILAGLLAGVLLPGAAAPGPSVAAPLAQPTREQLREAEQARSEELAAQREAVQRAAAARGEAQKLAAQHERILARLHDAELATSAAVARIAALAERRREAAARLALRAADLTPLLPVLERLALFPAETMLAAPVAPEQAVRGALVLGGILRTLEHEARALRAEQAVVAVLQAQLDAEMPRLTEAQAAQERAAQALDEQLRATRAEGRTAEDEAGRAARRAAAEAARADGLKAAIAQLEAERRAAEAQARREADEAARKRQASAAAAARSRQAALAAPAGPGIAEVSSGGGSALTAPVSGTLVRGFGETTDSGPATGLSYQAAPGARVFSPCGGRIVFAGPFRSFGQMVIVDCGGGYHFVLAGFERIDLGVGQKIASGAPVGVMPGWDPRTGSLRPSLYVELRRAGQAVNPAPFLRTRS